MVKIKAEGDVNDVSVKRLFLFTKLITCLSFKKMPVLDSSRKRGICLCLF